MSDFVTKLGRAFTATAMRRVSDHFFAGSSAWYPEQGICAPVRTGAQLLLLLDRGPLGITDIATQLRQSHPTIIVWSRELEKLGLIKTSTSRTDKRRKIVSLTRKGTAEATRVARAIRIVERAYDDLCAEVGADIYDALIAMERACQTRPMLLRLRDAEAAGLAAERSHDT